MTAIDSPNGEVQVDLVAVDSIDMSPIEWMWPGNLALGKLHILAGAPGTGKTTLSMAIAATVSNGSTWPDGTQSIEGKVLIWSGEDDPSDTLKPRLVAHGARTANCFVVGDVRLGDQPRSFDPAIDMPILLAAAECAHRSV
ncbi:MAG: AAA family ATPase [Lysobacteraceae bacterium]